MTNDAETGSVSESQTQDTTIWTRSHPMPPRRAEPAMRDTLIGSKSLRHGEELRIIRRSYRGTPTSTCAGGIARTECGSRTKGLAVRHHVLACLIGTLTLATQCALDDAFSRPVER